MTALPLIPRYRDALSRLLVSERRGGEGWHRESPAYASVKAILDRDALLDGEDDWLRTALRLQQRHSAILASEAA